MSKEELKEYFSEKLRQEYSSSEECEPELEESVLESEPECEEVEEAEELEGGGLVGGGLVGGKSKIKLKLKKSAAKKKGGAKVVKNPYFDFLGKVNREPFWVTFKGKGKRDAQVMLYAFYKDLQADGKSFTKFEKLMDMLNDIDIPVTLAMVKSAVKEARLNAKWKNEKFMSMPVKKSKAKKEAVETKKKALMKDRY